MNQDVYWDGLGGDVSHAVRKGFGLGFRRLGCGDLGSGFGVCSCD